jgi:hypothetical protein
VNRVADDRYTLLLTESLRQLDAQLRDLDQLRARASWLISAAAVSTSFLGAGLVRVQAIEGLGWLAILLFAATLVLALWSIAGPVSQTPVGFSPAVVEEAWIRERGLSVDEVRLNLALQIAREVDDFELRLDMRRRALSIGAVTLGLEIGVWLVHLS